MGAFTGFYIISYSLILQEQGELSELVDHFGPRHAETGCSRQVREKGLS